jgi:hypothetical protein
MDKFVQLPDRAAQVEELNLTIKPECVFNRRTLFSLFPNAKTMILKTTVPTHTSKPSHSREPIDIPHSKSKLVHLSDFYQCDLVSQMLHSNLGDRLKSLYLDCRWALHTPVILSQLKSLAVLKKLSLLWPIITLDNLEEMRTNMPSIQDFVLEEFDLLAGNMPSDIVPATSITRLDVCVGDIDHVETHTQLYQYMAKKYINIVDIEYKDEGLIQYDPNERKQIYLNGLFDFLRLIGPHKSELALSALPDDIDAFEVLDSVDSKIKALRLSVCDGETLFQSLLKSRQSKYIEKVDIVDTRIDSGHLLKGLPGLASLSIQSREFPPPIYLVDCFEICSSTLKHLHIKCYGLVVAPFKTQFDAIQTLNISFVRFTKNFGDIISSCFPIMVDLTLKGSVAENLNIVLKNPCFQKATLLIGSVMVDKSYRYGFSFNAPNLTEHYASGTTSATRVQLEYLQELPVLSIETFTDKRLKVDSDIHILPC